jgi:hypothetical protein
MDPTPYSILVLICGNEVPLLQALDKYLVDKLGAPALC